MGTPTDPIRRLAWNATIGGMLAHGVRVRLSCQPCEVWAEIDVEELAMGYGHDATCWDLHPPCPACNGPANFHASPGAGTPFRPLFA